MLLVHLTKIDLFKHSFPSASSGLTNASHVRFSGFTHQSGGTSQVWYIAPLVSITLLMGLLIDEWAYDAFVKSIHRPFFPPQEPFWQETAGKHMNYGYFLFVYQSFIQPGRAHWWQGSAGSVPVRSNRAGVPAVVHAGSQENFSDTYMEQNPINIISNTCVYLLFQVKTTAVTNVYCL